VTTTSFDSEDSLDSEELEAGSSFCWKNGKVKNGLCDGTKVALDDSVVALVIDSAVVVALKNSSLRMKTGSLVLDGRSELFRVDDDDGVAVDECSDEDSGNGETSRLNKEWKDEDETM